MSFPSWLASRSLPILLLSLHTASCHVNKNLLVFTYVLSFSVFSLAFKIYYLSFKIQHKCPLLPKAFSNLPFILAYSSVNVCLSQPSPVMSWTLFHWAKELLKQRILFYVTELLAHNKYFFVIKYVAVFVVVEYLSLIKRCKLFTLKSQMPKSSLDILIYG